MGTAGELRAMSQYPAAVSGDLFITPGVAYHGSVHISFASAGDVNGDGFDDFIVGTPYANNEAAGSSYVVFGKANLASLDGADGFTLSGAEPGG